MKDKTLLGNKWVRFFGPLAIMALAAFLLRDKMPFLATGMSEMLRARPGGLIASFIAVALSMWAMAEVMRRLLNAGGYSTSPVDTLALTFIANSWSSTFPGGAAISTVYQFRTMRTWGVSVMVSSWFIMLSGALSTVWLIALGLISIFFLGASFSLTPLIGSAIILIGLALLVWWAANNPQPSSRFVIRILHGAGKVLRKDFSAQQESLKKHFFQLDAVRLSPTQFLIVALLSLSNWVLDILALWLCVGAVTGIYPAFEWPENHTTVLGITLAFVTAKIVGSAQITPAGVGPVEAAMTASLVAVGMTASSAFGVVFVYRIISFAFITIIGWLWYFVSVARGGMRAQEA
ncbi:MAG: YbhN family protein [Corynebacterium sp.]|uniref:lysylphosphatidylglycerol synthase transmembrane domain-containing protein n=1 Tax=Corynebacterium sp. TaxID=1720 RepID=UPI0026DBC0B4|nr:YbhN family protein [Corynebacterium sp.]MDO4761172.1 YbhN family protein [Corynebacterium sp.]